MISLLSGKEPLTGQHGLYASAVMDRDSKEIVIKIVNAGTSVQAVNLNMTGVKKLNDKAKVTLLKSDQPDAVNSIDHPLLISPKEKEISIRDKKIEISLEPLSFYVVRAKLL